MQEMTMSSNENRKLFYDRLSELYRLQCISGLLGWDQRVYMPPKGAQARAEQREYMAILGHQKATDPEFIRAVDELHEEMDKLSVEDQVNVRETKRELDIQRKLPEDFVSEMSQAASLGYSTWVAARPADDFKAVQPSLEKLVELSKRKIELLGYKEHPYDAEAEPEKRNLAQQVPQPNDYEQRKDRVCSKSTRYGCKHN
jgi:carboxypeptidase Taq